MTVIELLPYVLPPVLGAVIGYVTNYLAIRMLFRPLEAKKVFGIRLPFTPGIIPRQRYQLSHSIAQMVSTKLLTGDVVRDRLSDPEFSENLQASVSRFTEDLLNGPAPEPPGVSTAPGGVPEMISTMLAGFLRSDSFRDSARQIVANAVDGALDMSVATVTPREGTVRNIVDNGLRAIGEGSASDAIRKSVVRWVEGHVRENTPLRDVLGKKALQHVADLLPRSYDPLLESLVSFLRRPDTHKELALHGRVLVKRIVGRLSAVQRLFVSAAQYDRNISENMPDIVSDVINSLETAGRKPENARDIISVFQQRLDDWANTGIGALTESLSLDLATIAENAVSRVLEMLVREDVRKGVGDSIVSFLDRHGERSLSSVLEDVAGLHRDMLHERTAEILDRWLDGPAAAERISTTVTGFIRRRLVGPAGGSLGSLLNLTSEQKAHIDRTLASKLAEQLEVRVPELVEGLNVYSMVVEKIDSLNVESVEQLLLMVIAKHLKWINLFGALLGGVIGGIQVVVSRIL